MTTTTPCRRLLLPSEKYTSGSQLIVTEPVAIARRGREREVVVIVESAGTKPQMQHTCAGRLSILKVFLCVEAGTGCLIYCGGWTGMSVRWNCSNRCDSADPTFW